MYPISVGVIIGSSELWQGLQGALETLAVRILFELPEIGDDWPGLLERIDRMKPDVVLVDVTRLHEPLESVVRRIRSSSARPLVFALHSVADSAAILAALRAGASEYLYPPFAEPLKDAIERISAERAKSHETRRAGGRSIGFVSAKGGCGATTVALHVAVELPTQTNGQVLLADLDLQSGMVGFLLKTHSAYSVADAANNLLRLDHSFWRGIISNGIPNLEILTAPSTPAAKDVTAGQLKQVLAFARTLYDWTVVDLGRNLNPASLTLLDVIDSTYLVTSLEVPALHHAKQVIQFLLDGGYSRENLHLILNRASKRSEVTPRELESMLGLPIYATLSNDYAALQEAYTEGHLLSPASKLGREFANLARRISGLGEVRTKKFSLFG